MGRMLRRENVRMIRVDNLFKIYGDNPSVAFDMLGSGISPDRIHHEIGNVVAVNNVSFEAHAEIFVIMGLSGSGKSTLLRCINRLIEPNSGDILLSDRRDGTNFVSITRCSPSELREIRRFRLSMVFQNFGLLPNRDVLSNVSFGLEVRRSEGKSERLQKSREAIEAVGLEGWENALLSQLSGGMKQRVGLARAFVTDAEVLLMDEPFSALDPLIRSQLQTHFLKLLVEKEMRDKTVIFVTHDLQEAMKLGNRIAIMEKGSFVQIGTPEEIILAPKTEYVSEFVKDVNPVPVISVRHVVMPIGSSDGSCGGMEPGRSDGRIAFQFNGDRFVVVLSDDPDTSMTCLINDRPIPVTSSFELAQNEYGRYGDDPREIVICVGSECLLEEAIIAKSHTRYPLIVCDGGKVLGIVREKDILKGIIN